MPLRLFIWITLLLALGLQVMPMPDAWLIWRPNWLGMMLAYWCIAAPSRVGVFYGWSPPGWQVVSLKGIPWHE